MAPATGSPCERGHRDRKIIAAAILSLTLGHQAVPVMTVPLALHLVPLAGFTGLMAVAAVEDLRRLVIPNALILALCVLWPLHLALAPNLTLATGGLAAGCAAAVFVVGAVLFSRGLVGGGDVKLLTAATLWAGPAATPALLVWTGLLGGLLSLALLTPFGSQIAAARPVAPGSSGAAANEAHPVAVPYGVAIATAAILVTIPPNFSW
jgi:prepilin peptidase CpaA